MNKTEQLSTSTQNPKIELPNKTLVGVKPTETKSEEIGKTPKPTGWRILVLPFKQKEKTKGGLISCKDNPITFLTPWTFWISFFIITVWSHVYN